MISGGSDMEWQLVFAGCEMSRWRSWNPIKEPSQLYYNSLGFWGTVDELRVRAAANSPETTGPGFLRLPRPVFLHQDLRHRVCPLRGQHVHRALELGA